VLSDLLHGLLTNTWSALLIILFFGGSIFVHELGHYLLAKARGVHVDVFSIGFGPPIFSWKAKDGTRYQVAWFPLGGYVLLPQIADLGTLKGESTVKAEELPPVSYPSKLIVFVAGAAFNVLFAFVLACYIWIAGQREFIPQQSTQIGFISKTIDLPDGSKAESPALKAGLRVGDTVKAVDGHRVSSWSEMTESLVTGTGREAGGDRITVFSIERDGKALDITVHPLLAGAEKVRRVGIAPAYPLNIGAVKAGSAAETAGLRAGDRILSIESKPILTYEGLVEGLGAVPESGGHLKVLRAGSETELAFKGGTAFADGIELNTEVVTHPNPLVQLWVPFVNTFRTVWSLVAPGSDMGLSKVSGPIGIIHVFRSASESGLSVVLQVTILINVNLAVLNLLPIPVLDGGQIVLATIARLRGRPLPVNFVVGLQSVFMVLLVSMVLYVSIFDVRRWRRDAAEERAAVEAAAQAKH
jgi:regulator of sigma E protease